VPGGRQLLLPFDHQPAFGSLDFVEAPSNAAALAWLGRAAHWPERRLVLWGEAGCGKTHLLHLWSKQVGAEYLSGPALQQTMPKSALAIDDADAVADETTLLHLLNAAGESGWPVLLAGRSSPARWPVGLPDLASRLRAATAVEIATAEESLLRALLVQLLSDRQLSVPPAVQEWLLVRLPRTPAALRQAVAELDSAALTAGRAITRPFAATVLARLMEADGLRD
jgi:chromosomal replication initiation ATPase DnaA